MACCDPARLAEVHVQRLKQRHNKVETVPCQQQMSLRQSCISACLLCVCHEHAGRDYGAGSAKRQCVC